MPGIFVRTKEIRDKISNSLKGRSPVNKGHVNNALIAEINKVIVSSTVILTRLQIYKILVAQGILPDNVIRYQHFCYYLNRAYKTGRTDRNQVCNAQGHGHHTERRRFHIGDKVRIIRQQKYTPLWLRRELRLNNIRTITTVIPPHRSGANGALYYLGHNGIGDNKIEIHPFRAIELEIYTKKTTAGRPSTKRKYTRQSKDTSPVISELLINPSVSPSISCVKCELAEAN